MGFFSQIKQNKKIIKDIESKYSKLNGSELFFGVNYKNTMMGFKWRDVGLSIDNIENLLLENEKIERLTLPDTNNTTAVACTANRIIVAKDASGRTIHEVNYKDIISVEKTMFTPLKITPISSKVINVGMMDVHKDAGESLYHYVKAKVSEMKNTKNQAPSSNADEIEKLYNLKEKGIISEQEFEKNKKKILG